MNTTKEIKKVLTSGLLKQARESVGEYAPFFCDYDGNVYICDAITEIAYNNTSIYYSDIYKFIGEHPEAVEDAINEFGWDGCGGELYKAGQMGEFLQIERDIYNDLDNAILLWAYDYILNVLEINELSEKDADALAGCLESIDNNNRFDDIVEIINDVLNIKEEVLKDEIL